ncbi:sigma-54 interaction domain-containing protein [Alkalihalophilus sp. As8PL]|uniref:HTH-type transcriptional regulatory protein TyrR n=1 Tax=Alkalihalophilus sp. As8PL TaxID=3237103 RepID=A0AB39BWF9_9BACI
MFKSEYSIDKDSLHSIPFPSFIGDEKGEIMIPNTLMNKVLQKNDRVLDGNHTIKRYFNNNMLEMVIHDHSYLFIRSEMDDTSNIEYLYIGVELSTNENSIEKLMIKLKDTEQLNRELDAIIENSYDVIYITDNTGMTLKTNSAIERITGIPKEYYIGKKVDELIKRGILQNSVTHHVLRKRRTVSFVQSNFQGKETLITGNPVFDKNGEIEKIVTNIRDLSELNELQVALRKAMELNETYKKELEQLKGKTFDETGVVISSPELKLIFETANRIANVDATVLILGETGVGKDVLAKYIYNNSIRAKEGNFIKVNCGAIPPDLLESELFGYESGAFTGASKNGKAGMFELADNGILFLDEIGELSLSLQVKLLRVLQEQEIMRVGGTKTKKVNVRVIAATNRILKDMVREGSFREDLYYRLNVIPIKIPPLRERRDDIVPLISMFLNQINQKYNMKKTVSHKLKNFFYSCEWSGNVRELSNLIERLVLVTSEEEIDLKHLPDEYLDPKKLTDDLSESFTLKQAVENAEKKVLALAAEKYDNTYDIAKRLETSQPTIVRKLKKYNLSIKK